jgi:hypothetical protein
MMLLMPDAKSLRGRGADAAGLQAAAAALPRVGDGEKSAERIWIAIASRWGA